VRPQVTKNPQAERQWGRRDAVSFFHVRAFEDEKPNRVPHRSVLDTARAAGGTVRNAQKRHRGGYSGHFTDPDHFHWEVAPNPHPIGGVTLP
jgi:hypothetical protein